MEGPDEAGQSAETEEYTTGNFGVGKYMQLCWAMTAFPHEYAVDAELQDLFGSNGSLLVNSVLKQVDPPGETVPSKAVVQYSNAAELEAATHQIEAAIQEHGACLLRYRGDECASLPALVPALSRAAGISQPIDYAKAGGTDVRPAVEGLSTGAGAIYATDFPPTSSIPAHYELLYTPQSPDRIGFVCLVKPDLGGETTIFDGKSAMDALTEGAARCKLHTKLLERIVSGDRLSYRRILTPPSAQHEIATTTITDWNPLFGDVGPSEALELARKMGFEAELLSTGELQIDYAHEVLCPLTGGLKTSACAQKDIVYEVFYRDGTTGSHKEISWESDGVPLTNEDVLIMSGAFAQSRVFFKWDRPGDAIFLDNQRFAHGRMPYRGNREIGVFVGNTK